MVDWWGSEVLAIDRSVVGKFGADMVACVGKVACVDYASVESGGKLLVESGGKLVGLGLVEKIVGGCCFLVGRVCHVVWCW